MTATLDLLKLSPADALRTIIQGKLKVGFEARYLQFGEPSIVSGPLTRIPLSVDKSIAPVKYWAYGDVGDFDFLRLDYSDVFGGLGTVIEVDYPTSVDAIADALTSKYDIRFSQDDYVPGELVFGEGADFVLQAKPESLRWIGQVPIVVQPKKHPLNTTLTEKALAEFSYTIGLDDSEPRARLLNELNTLNATNLYRPLLIEELSWSDPVAVNDGDVEGNTSVTLTIVGASLWTGSAAITYRRLHFPRLVNYNPVDITSLTVDSHRTLAATVATQLGIYIDLNDIVEDILPYQQIGETATVTINFKPSSLMYWGEITVDWTKA